MNDLEAVLTTLDSFDLLDKLKELRVGNVSFSLSPDVTAVKEVIHPYHASSNEDYDSDILFAAANSK